MFSIRFYFVVLLFCGLTTSVSAQSCVTTSKNPWEWPGHNNWFIGTFSGASNVTGKMINFSAGFTKTQTGKPFIDKGTPVYEGVTAASNDKGELVVFSNGRWAWNSNSVRTSKGIKEGNEGGFNIVGSASQGIIAVRHPLNPFDYYIITVGDVIGGANPPLGYNIFDENGNEKQAFKSLGVNATEGIAATFHENGVDIWVSVLQYQSNVLHSFLLTCDGFVTPSVKTSLGYIQSGDAGRGGIAFSHDSKKFVACFPNAWPNADRQVVLYDFNNRTGKFSNRKSIGPTGAVIGPYDVVFSKDNSKVYVTGGNAGGVHSVNVTTGKYKKETGLGELSLHHAVEIGADGNYYFNGKDGLWRWSGSGSFTKVDGTTGQGLPSMFIPPQEEPEIQMPAPMCDTSSAVDLSTIWLCSGLDAEDTVTGPSHIHSRYSGPGIVSSTKGIFDPKVAKEGIHQIIFTRCSVDDTIFIQVTKCVECIDTLKNVTPEICAGEQVNLTALVDTSNGAGLWTIKSKPNTSSVDPIIDDTQSDTIFDASDLNTRPGVYELLFTVKIANLTCKDSLNIVVNKNPVVTVNDSIICAGSPDALFTAKADSSIVKYEWGGLGSGNTSSTNGNVAGEYSVKVTDLNGCVDSAKGNLKINALPVVKVNNDTICKGEGKGTFKAISDSSVTTYLWSGNGSGTTQTINGITSGNYSVLVIDKNGCVGNATGELKVNEPPVVSVNDAVICAGDSAAEFKAISDSLAVEYLWSDNGSGTNASTYGDKAGVYTVTVKDINGCIGKGTGVLTVNALPVITVNDESICKGDSAVIFTATSDSTPISYLWSDKGSGTFSTTKGNVAGIYSVTVTDKNGCIGKGSGNLSVNELPVISVNNAEICKGDADAEFKVTSDSSLVTYKWSENGSGTNATATGNVAGNYTVEVTDINGCIGKATGVLTVHDLPVVTMNGGNVCPNTPFTLTPVVTTKNEPVKYDWGNGDTSKTYSTGPGNYSVNVIDAKGCKGSASASVLEDPNLTVVIPGPVNLCEGESKKLTSNFKAEDGYSFVWAKGGNTIGSNDFYVADSSGIYNLKVNKGNCKGDASVNVTVNKLPEVTVKSHSICRGDNPVVFEAISSTAIDYQWSENGNGNLKTTSGSSAGNYKVTVKDNNGCEYSAIGVLSVFNLPIVNVNSEIICEGDSAAVFTASSPTAVQYSWSKNGSGNNKTTSGLLAGEYEVEVVDSNGCKAKGSGFLAVKANPKVTVNNELICEGDAPAVFKATSDSTVVSYLWSDNGTGTLSTTQGDKAGKYTVTVIDKNGCEGSGAGNLVVEGLPNVGNIPASICSGEAANIGEIVQSGSYTYLWTSSVDGENGVTSPNYTAKKGGSYTRTVTSTSPAACVSTSTYIVTEHPKPSINVSDETKCEGEVMTLLDSESTTGFSYKWTPGNHTGPSINPTISGKYQVTKTNDLTGCEISTSANALFIPIPKVKLDQDTVEICEGDKAIVSVNHDAQSISWTGGSVETFAEYTTQGDKIVVGSNGTCKASDTMYVRVNHFPKSELDKKLEGQLICFEELDTLINLTAGDSRKYDFSWNTGETTSSINVDQEGTYSVTISNKSCSVYDEIRLKNYCPWSLFVPTAITPNDDGLNDVFNAKAHNLIDYQLLVFNRWGEQIYSTSSLNGGWDGTYMGNEVQIDVYVWKVNYSFEDESGAIKRDQKVGTVTVVK